MGSQIEGPFVRLPELSTVFFGDFADRDDSVSIDH